MSRYQMLLIDIMFNGTNKSKVLTLFDGTNRKGEFQSEKSMHKYVCILYV